MRQNKGGAESGKETTELEAGGRGESPFGTLESPAPLCSSLKQQLMSPAAATSQCPHLGVFNGCLWSPL